MYIALDENGNRVEIKNAEKGKDYFCPVCNTPLVIKAGEQRAKHFAHKAKTDCDTWADMSEWHYAWQEKFSSEYREIVLEYNGSKHRADVLAEHTVIEFQHSAISSKEFKERNQFYTGCGYRVVWVFDMREKLGEPIQEESAVRFLSKQGQFFEYDIDKKITLFLEIAEKDIAKFTGLFSISHGDSHKWLVRVDQVSNDKFTYLPWIFSQENFLKQYKAMVAEGVCSIMDIVRGTMPEEGLQEIEQKSAQRKSPPSQRAQGNMIQYRRQLQIQRNKAYRADMAKQGKKVGRNFRFRHF